MISETCQDCRTCGINDRCRAICETIEAILPSMERGRVDFEDLPRIYEGRIITHLILDNEDILAPRQREIVRLYYREASNQEDIGTALGITQQAVADSLKAVRLRFMRMYRTRKGHYDTTERGRYDEIEDIPAIHFPDVTDGENKA
jgi:predicted DNA-binding protein YlxM (UPF0122 family)